MLSDPVIHASHACALRITKQVDGSSVGVHDLVHRHMSNGLPTVLWCSIPCTGGCAFTSLNVRP
eukprot:1735558-Amphidinium_carterae.1